MSDDRRTKRRYAHELYPHGEEYEVRPLAVEVPYHYARAVGFDVQGTNWFDAEPRVMGDRINAYVQESRLALLLDALLQGLTGDEAWKWADEKIGDDNGWMFERAAHYGVPIDQIKPYLCNGEPDHHEHLGEPDKRGWRVVTRTPGKESECPECTEPIEPEATR